MTDRKVRVAFLSPAGTTKKVAEAIAGEAGRQGWSVVLEDLAGPEANVQKAAARVEPGDVLFVGSPVYAHHPVPPVMDFIAALLEGSGIFAVPFVTYGMVCSGVALHDLAVALEGRGLRLAGGFKLPTQHSLSWRSDPPLGTGRPGEAEEKEVVSFVRSVLAKVAQADCGPMASDVMNYQPERISAESAQASLEMLRGMFPPLGVDADACTQVRNLRGKLPDGQHPADTGGTLHGRPLHPLPELRPPVRFRRHHHSGCGCVARRNPQAPGTLQGTARGTVFPVVRRHHSTHAGTGGTSPQAHVLAGLVPAPHPKAGINPATA